MGSQKKKKKEARIGVMLSPLSIPLGSLSAAVEGLSKKYLDIHIIMNYMEITNVWTSFSASCCSVFSSSLFHK